MSSFLPYILIVTGSGFSGAKARRKCGANTKAFGLLQGRLSTILCPFCPIGKKTLYSGMHPYTSAKGRIFGAAGALCTNRPLFRAGFGRSLVTSFIEDLPSAQRNICVNIAAFSALFSLTVGGRMG